MAEKPAFNNNSFRPSLSANPKQIIAIIVIFAIIVAVPFGISYLQSPNKSTPQQIFERAIASFSSDSTGGQDQQTYITIPVISQKINVTVLKKNPQIVSYAGIGLLIVAGLVAITLLRKR